MSERTRVFHVREVAVVGEHALIGGRSAWRLWQLLERLPGGLEAQLARLGLPQEDRVEVLRAQVALGQAGSSWRTTATSTSGTPGSQPAGSGVRSEHVGATEQLLTSTEAARVLGVSGRHVRGDLAVPLGGTRDAGGRWRFRPQDVEAERRRRMTGTAAA